MSVLDKVRTIEKDGIIYYRLKDLHKLANCGRAKEPGGFLRQAADFIRNADSRFGINQTLKNFDTDYGSVYATELVCIRYAAYINPDFEINVYQEFLKRHTLAEAIASATQYKADVLDKMCHKGNNYSITEAAMEVAKITGLRLSTQDLNRILAGEGIHKENWYKAKGCKRAFRQAVVDRGYGTYYFVVDGKGNKHRCDRLTSKGIQYIANWLMKYFFVFPQRQKQQLQPTFDPSEILNTEMSRGASC